MTLTVFSKRLPFGGEFC